MSARIEVDEIGSALRYLAQVRADSSMAYASKHAHDHMMHIALRVENDRLRGLIADAQFRGAPHEYGTSADEPTCPWCSATMWIQVGGVGEPMSRSMQGMHMKDCPAFTTSGDIK